MALPEQIRKQSEDIAKLYQELEADKNPPKEGEADEGKAAPDATDSAPNPAPSADPNEQGKPAPTSDAAEQRYRTLQGMYNADTARLKSANQQLEARVSHLEGLLSSLSAKPAEPATQTKLITDKDVAEYGDSIDVMRRVTQEENAQLRSELARMEQMLTNLQTTVVPRIDRVASQQVQTETQMFWGSLNEIVPDWREVNDNKDFHSWLLEVDPLTNTTRQSLLEDAQRNMDAQRVANFFRVWKAKTGHSVAQPNPRDAQRSVLEKQVSPGRGRTASAATPDAPKQYTNAEIQQFYVDVRKGLYKGREAERDRIESDIFAATRDGRIVANG